MQESKPLHDEQRRRLMLLGAGAAVVGGWACANNPYKDYPAVGQPRISDDVFAFGLPDQKMLEGLETKDAIAFLGVHQTYLIVYGGSDVSGLARNTGNKLQFENDRQTMFVQGKVFWGKLSFLPSGGSWLEVFGAILPPVIADGLDTGSKVLPLTFRDPRSSDSAPRLRNYSRTIPDRVFVIPQGNTSNTKLGGFPAYSISASR